MTTSACDIEHSHCLAADSRWTAADYCEKTGQTIGPAFAYVDVPEFSKLIHSENLCAITAGNETYISKFKKWVVEGGNPSKVPDIADEDTGRLEAWIVLVRKTSEGIARLEDLTPPEFRSLSANKKQAFLGTGGEIARTRWEETSCAKDAVDYAKEKDLHSGGNTATIFINTGAFNKNKGAHTSDIETLNILELLDRKGKIVYQEQKKGGIWEPKGKPVDYSKAVAANKDAKALHDRIETKEIVGRACIGGPPIFLTKEQRADVRHRVKTFMAQ